jgi:hypothetical protein
MQLHRQNAHVSAGSRLLRRTIPLAIATALVAIAGLTLSATLIAADGKGQGECNVATLRGRYLFPIPEPLSLRHSGSQFRRQRLTPDSISSMETVRGSGESRRP